MRAVIQRVKESNVTVDNEVVGSIGPGFLVLLGVGGADHEKDADYLVEKIVNLRVFEDQNGKLNKSLIETGGEVLVVSQFTLLADYRKGRRPSFTAAAPPDRADTLYQYFVKKVRGKGITVETGRFRAKMAVSLINDGPVTLIMESPHG